MASLPTSIEHGTFDTAALQKELMQALKDDRLYRLTDSVKKRAIHTAANYDEFKNLVACADLKPISQKELHDFSRSERHTNISFKKNKSRDDKSKHRFELEAPVLHVGPATAVDFCRNWKRYLKTTDDKIRYLHITTPKRLGDMFKSDIDSDLLADIVQVLVASWHQKSTDENPEESSQQAFALSVLEALSRTARLSLTLSFFEDHQTNDVQELLSLIENSGGLSEKQWGTLKRLKKLFQLK